MAVYPKVKVTYIAGDVKGARVGKCKKRSGRVAHGVKIDYEQTRAGYARSGFQAQRGGTRYDVAPAKIRRTKQRFTKIVDIPRRVTNIAFRGTKLPEHYRSALQSVS